MNIKRITQNFFLSLVYLWIPLGVHAHEATPDDELAVALHAQEDAEAAAQAGDADARIFVPEPADLEAVAPEDLILLGEWGGVITWPHVPVSAANLADGRVLTWSSSQRNGFPSGDPERTYTATWDPSNGNFVEMLYEDHDMFCSHQVVLEDGKIFVNGGRNTVRFTSVFDPTTNSWSRIDDMNDPRWYPTSIYFPEGNVFTASGRGGSNTAEMWSPSSGWDRLTGLDWDLIVNNPGFETNWWPYIFLTPRTKLFHAGPTRDMNMIDVAGEGTMFNLGRRFDTDWYPKHAGVVMYDEGKILIAGGATGHNIRNSTNQALTIDINGEFPQVTSIAPMLYARRFQNAVMLPNGEVLIVGGNTSGRKFNDDGTVLEVEIWNPQSGAWREVANMSVPRNYHSIALLLTDGRVLSGGGGLCGSCSVNHADAQVYSPPYLFNPDGSLAARPQISQAPDSVRHGETIFVQATANIQRFSLIKMTSTTHAVNTDLRYLSVPFTETAAGQYELSMHSNPYVLPPGYYMLFAVNSQGVPSVAKVLRVSSAGAPVVLNPATDILGVITNAEGDNVSVPISASDPNNDPLTYSATGLPPNLSIDPNTGEISGVISSGSAGSYNVVVLVSDGVGAVSVSFIWTVNPPGLVQTIEVRINAGGDDVEQQVSGALSITSSDLELVSASGGNQTVGMRFNAVNIPQGAIVTNAYLQFQVDEVDTVATSLTIAAEAVDNASAFVSVPFNVSSRSRTFASVSWAPAEWTVVGQAGALQRSPDLSSVVQEIVQRAGWSNGSSMVFIITGSGQRTAESYNGVPAAAPLLHVEYVTDNTLPTVTLTAPPDGLTISQGTDITFTATASDTEDGDITASLVWASDLDGSIGSGGSFSINTLSEGTHTITATATDSDSLTGFDTISITVAAAGNAPPTASITAPANGSSFTVGDNISFTGTGNDLEDSDVTPSLAWDSDLDGAIGNGGGSFSITTLSEGTHTITVTATDSGSLTGSDTITVNVLPPGGGTTTLSIPINLGSDDAEEKPAGNVIIGSQDLDLVASGGNQTVGMRFNNVKIPQNATIVDAFIQFTAAAGQSTATSLTLEGEAADNAATFVNNINGNISNRPRTLAVAWSPAPWAAAGDAGVDQRTPDLTPIIQEIVNRTGWASNNSLAIIVTGTGKREADAFEANPSTAAVLHVEFANAGGNQPPTASITAPANGSNFTVGDNISFTGTGNDPEDGIVTTSLTWDSDLDGAIGTGGSFSTTLSEGAHTITATATDSGTLMDNDTITVTVLPPGGGTTTLSIPINAGSDDSEEQATGSVILGSKDLDLVRSGSDQTVGLRFNGLTIPQGAIIVDAYIQFATRTARSEPTSLTLEGQATDNAVTFVNNINGNISSRPRTTADIAWSPVPWTTVGETGVDQRTPNLTPIVQEIVNRAGWASSNSLAFIITGTGKRDAQSFETTPPASPPVLHVEFQ